MPNQNYFTDLESIATNLVEAPPSGSLRIANVAGTLKQVNPDSTTSAIGGGGGGLPSGTGLVYSTSGTGSIATAAQTLSVVVAGNSTKVTVTGSAVQDINFTGLSGDTDGDYEIEFYIVDSASGNISFQPNSDATNGISRGFYTNGTGTVTTQSGAGNLFINSYGAGVNAHGTAYFRSKSGQGNRYWRCVSQDETATNPYMYQQSGYWADTAQIITSARIHHSAAGGIGVGSWATIRKLGKV